MIELSSFALNKEACNNLARVIEEHGYEGGEQAERIADEIVALIIATLNTLDEKVKAVSSDDVDRTIVQQLVLYNLIQAFQRAMEANALESLLKVLGGRI